MNNAILISLGILILGGFFGLLWYVAKRHNEDTNPSPNEGFFGIYCSETSPETLVYVYRYIAGNEVYYKAEHLNLTMGLRFQQGSGSTVPEALQDSEKILGKLVYVESLGHIGLKTKGSTEKGRYVITMVSLAPKAQTDITVHAFTELSYRDKIVLDEGVSLLISLYRAMNGYN